MSIELKLKSLSPRVSRLINGFNIIKIEDNLYLIDGEQYSLKDAVNQLVVQDDTIEHNSAFSSNNKTTNFDKVIFIMIEPPCRIISTHRIENEDERQKLINEAIKKGLLLYFSDIRTRDGKFYAAQPWIIEWKTVPNDLNQRSKNAKKHVEVEHEEVTENSNSLNCPYCKKVLNSKFGKTNHVKSKHPEKIAEYLENYA